MFTNKKREGINTSVCAVSLYVTETPKASLKDHELPLPILPFGIVAHGSVWTTFVETAVYAGYVYSSKRIRYSLKYYFKESEGKAIPQK